jgi:integrase
MARSIRSGLESRSARLKLPVSSKPNWITIGPGLGVGYRRNKTAGNWVARIADGKGGYSTRNIGTADDYAEANNAEVLNYFQAQAKARQLVNGSAVQASVTTVNEALKQYAADIRTRGGDGGNASRLRSHLSPAMLRKPVALLSTAELRRWRDSLVKDLAASTVNRISAVFKAALNHIADQDERLTSRRAWEIGLATIANAEQSRNVILSEDVVRLIVIEARRVGTEFGLLVEVAAVTGARVSQLAQIEVQDLHGSGDAARLSIPVSAKGKGVKAVLRHTVPIGAALAARLRVAAAGRPATAPLLLRPSGDRWRKSDHHRPFARAVAAAGQDPAEVTIYALRHTSIVRQLLANVPIRIVATLHDTSVAMIERTYSRHIGDHSDALARSAMLNIIEPAQDVVTPLRKAHIIG